MPYAGKICLTKCSTKLFQKDKMSNYFILVYKDPTTKWMSVDWIITVFLCVIIFFLKCIVYINVALVNVISININNPTFLNSCANVTSKLN